MDERRAVAGRRRLRIAAAGLAGVALLGWIGAWAFEPCRPLDRWLGRSGCVGHARLQGIGMLRQTLAARPDGSLLVGGATFAESGSGTGRSTLVLLNQALEEIGRQETTPRGVLEQVAVSPDGQAIAATCNRQWSCEFEFALPSGAGPGGDGSRQVPVSLSRFRTDTAPDGPADFARLDWIRTIPEAEAGEAADGRAFALAFAADGRSLVAGRHGWGLDGGAVAQPAAAPLPTGFDRVAAAGHGVEAASERSSGRVLLRRGATTEPLDPALPAGFVPELHRPLALSPDGTRLAALYRRFDRGEPRALLRVWRIADGALTAAAALPEAYPALAWLPGDRVALALPVGPAEAGETELRLYAAGAAS